MTPRNLLWVVPAAFFGIFFVLPVATLLVTALGGASASTAQSLVSGSMSGVLWFTTYQAVLSTLLTVAIALPGAAVLARFRFRFRGTVEALSVVAFVMPTVVVAVAVAQALGVLGLPDQGLVAILVAHVYFNLAVVLRMVGTYWGQLDPRPEQVAACLGARPLTVFRTVTLPRIMPALASAAAIVFLFTFTSFGIVLLLGQAGQATLEVEIQRQALFLFNLPLAAALSLVQIVLVVALLIGQGRLTRRLGGTAGAGRLRPARTRREHLVVGSFAVVALVIFLGPVIAVVTRALRVGDGWGWDNFMRLSSTGIPRSRSSARPRPWRTR
ncbi:MAG: ABC transporter permease subunit [Candidatus Nanopelagicales bacterium]